MPSRTRTGPRVVLDTNVVLSALLFAGGAGAALRLAWQGGACEPLVSRVTTQELVRALAYPKFRLSTAGQHELLADYLPYARVVRMPSSPPAVPLCRDVHDQPFLELALVGKARSLVSGDRDLLALRESFTVPILTLAEFLVGLDR